MKVESLDHLVLTVANIAATEDFFHPCLGHGGYGVGKRGDTH